MNRLPMCCGTPCVSTFLFDQKELFCIRCRKSWPLFGTRSAEATDELLAERERNREEFKTMSKGAVHPRVMFDWCDECSFDSRHWDHITEEERQESREAYGRLVSA